MVWKTSPERHKAPISNNKLIGVGHVSDQTRNHSVSPRKKSSVRTFWKWNSCHPRPSFVTDSLSLSISRPKSIRESENRVSQKLLARKFNQSTSIIFSKILLDKQCHDWNRENSLERLVDGDSKQRSATKSESTTGTFTRCFDSPALNHSPVFRTEILIQWLILPRTKQKWLKVWFVITLRNVRNSCLDANFVSGESAFNQSNSDVWDPYNCDNEQHKCRFRFQLTEFCQRDSLVCCNGI